MDFRLRHPPWTGKGLVPEDVFLRQVSEALTSEGHWESYGEYRMGAGPTVSIEVVPRGNERAYRAAAKWMDWAFTLTGEYESIEDALTALPLFEDAMFEVLSAGGGKGLANSTDVP